MSTLRARATDPAESRSTSAMIAQSSKDDMLSASKHENRLLSSPHATMQPSLPHEEVIMQLPRLVRIRKLEFERAKELRN